MPCPYLLLKYTRTWSWSWMFKLEQIVHVYSTNVTPHILFYLLVQTQSATEWTWMSESKQQWWSYLTVVFLYTVLQWLIWTLVRLYIQLCIWCGLHSGPLLCELEVNVTSPRPSRVLIGWDVLGGGVYVNVCSYLYLWVSTVQMMWRSHVGSADLIIKRGECPPCSLFKSRHKNNYIYLFILFMAEGFLMASYRV